MKSEAITKLSLAVILIVAVGCHKKVAQAPLPPAPQPEVAKAAPPPEPPPKREEPKVVEAKPEPAPPPPEVKVRVEDLLAKIQDAYFDYDKHNIRPDAETTLQSNAIALREIFKQFPGYKVTIEGYCDERGSDEYNLALGDQRSKNARDYLVRLGLPVDQITTVSFGKEKPVCTEHDESCWQKNRRAHTAAQSST